MMDGATQSAAFKPATVGAAGLGMSVEAGSVAYAPLGRAIERLEEVIEQETKALKYRAAIDLEAFNVRKSQGLLDLNRALRGLDGLVRDKLVQARLAGLRAKLEVNQAVLKVHLEAVREVAGVLADAIRDAESDGTYSPSIRNGGRP